MVQDHSWYKELGTYQLEREKAFNRHQHGNDTNTVIIQQFFKPLILKCFKQTTLNSAEPIFKNGKSH